MRTLNFVHQRDCPLQLRLVNQWIYSAAMDERQVAGRQLHAVTALLKEHRADVSTRKFNDLLTQAGLLEERHRASTADPTKTKAYKALTDDGLAFGENVGNDYTDETQPRYFAETFAALMERLGVGTKPA